MMPRAAGYIRTLPIRVTSYEAERRIAHPWRSFYKTARWQAIRLQQLSSEPLCRFCMRDGRIEAAAIVDHIEAHRGCEVKFFAGPFQSLCKRCHDSEKQRSERFKAV